MKARDIMSPDPEVVTRDDTLQQAAALMRERDVGILPVVDDRSSMRLAGVITDRDIVVRHTAEGHQGDCPVSEHMSEGTMETVGPDVDLREVAQSMQRRQVRRIPVVENGVLIGIVSQADISAEDPSLVAKTVETISKPSSSN